MNEIALFNSLFNNSLGDGLMDDVFNFNYKNVNAPKVDIVEKADSYVLEMELPGRVEKDVNIEINDNLLTISSKKEEVSGNKEAKNKDGKEEGKKEGGKHQYLVRERRITSFSRSFTLPTDIETEGTKAVFKNGILTVTLPRRQAPTPKKISIQCE